ncbi:MAG: PIN domain-containing protein [Methylococcaceae bacterium]|nr:PIN domain-containing protein [Methylococcaceae bacterium]
MKIILDTNILVNVLLSPSKKSASYKVFKRCLTGQFKPQIGCALFNELMLRRGVKNKFFHVCI